jgi:hypothetical protein
MTPGFITVAQLIHCPSEILVTRLRLERAKLAQTQWASG